MTHVRGLLDPLVGRDPQFEKPCSREQAQTADLVVIGKSFRVCADTLRRNCFFLHHRFVDEVCWIPWITSYPCLSHNSPTLNYCWIFSLIKVEEGNYWSSGMAVVLGAIHLWRPQKITFLIPSPCPHASTWADPPLWTSTHGRHEIRTALLKWLVQWPTGPKAEIRLYDCNLFKLYF